jgi:hypothetical protein
MMIAAMMLLTVGTLAGVALATRTDARGSGSDLAVQQRERAIPQRAGIGDDDWKRLGEATVKHRAEKDEISVGADEGKFSKIKLEVRGADVEILRLKVVYRSGEDDDIEVKDNIKEGHQTRPLDLKGGDRFIKKVVLWYKTEAGEDHKARVILFGKD